MIQSHRGGRISLACNKLKRGFEVLTLGEMRFEGMGGVKKGL